MSLTNRPDAYFRVARQIAKEWGKMNERNLREAIKRLYQSKLIDCRENKDKSVSLILTDDGKDRILRHEIDKIEIKKPAHWDNLWRMVIFDIPEDKKPGRDALNVKLKEIGFYPMQKSVFIHPYECKDEIDFIIELFELAPHVRFLRVKDIDIELHLKDIFHL